MLCGMWPSKTMMNKGQQTFSVKDRVVNVFSFVGHTVSLKMTQFCCYRVKAAINNNK